VTGRVTPTGETPDGADAPTWRVVRARIAADLSAAGIDDAGHDARWIVEEVSGQVGAKVWEVLDEPVEHAALARCEALVARRAAGEPVQYVLGHWPFRSLELLVDRRALIPRPETEQVAELALVELGRVVAADREAPPLVVDLGTGSGALAFTFVIEVPGTLVWAVEADDDALALAWANRAALGLAEWQVQLLHGSWFDPLPEELRGQIDLVVSNPPYVGTDEVLPDSVARWEPARALYAGPDGLDAIAEIVAAAPEWLAPHGVLVVEIGAAQGDAATDLALRSGFIEVDVRPDLAGLDRVLVARRQPLGV
jgi:release factor glutamine methyltransferase